MKNLELFYLKIRWSDPSGLCRQSDGFIVLMNVGNATGGKGATYGNNQESNLRNT